MPIADGFRQRTMKRLTRLYGSDADRCFERIRELAGRYCLPTTDRSEPIWTERDVVLITYGDQIQQPGRSPLASLDDFLHEHRLSELIDTVHLLPFFPFSSDDGFSVIDYRQVDPRLGSWDDVGKLSQSCSLMFDLVLNHCSQQSAWFQHYLTGRDPYDKYFVEADPEADLSGVTRPRSTPVLTPFETSRGPRHVWTTFSSDQVDLNFANPNVLIEMLDILLFYVSQGARIIRLDAIAYLWKEIGTSCIHLPETHTVVKLMRDLLDEFAPGTILLTETNVPHEENVSYFGDGDEAQMVYQFSLAPLLLDAFLTGDTGGLSDWLSNLRPARPGTTFFNFTASHDGIGVRPLEGLVSRQRLNQLVEAVRARGGLVSTKRNPDGTDSPYELNVTYFSALGEPDGLSAELHARRFLTSQAIMLALKGIPGIYFHSLVGTPNDTQGVQQTGRSRSINRRKFADDELRHILEDEHSAQRQVFDGYRRLLRARISQPAFHPDAEQQLVDVGDSAVIAFRRTSLDQSQTVLVLANVSDRPVTIDLSPFADDRLQTNLLSGMPVAQDRFEMEPYGSAWLSGRSIR